MAFPGPEYCQAPRVAKEHHCGKKTVASVHLIVAEEDFATAAKREQGPSNGLLCQAAVASSCKEPPCYSHSAELEEWAVLGEAGLQFLLSLLSHGPCPASTFLFGAIIEGL